MAVRMGLIAREFLRFDGERGPDGKVRAGVWDYVCVPGRKVKDGMETDFNPETLGQMIDNFVARGDMVGLDYNHQSEFTHVNGQPAPGLAFYGALALVWDGKVVKAGAARDVEPQGTEGINLAQDGLYAYRAEVTEKGQELLPNFKYLSPTFSPDATDEQDNPIGYALYAVAATNSPFQASTEITFAKEKSQMASIDIRVGSLVTTRYGMDAEVLAVGEDAVTVRFTDGGVEKIYIRDIVRVKHYEKAGAAGTKGGHMAGKLSKLAKYVRMEDDEDEEKVKAAALARMEEEARKMEDDDDGDDDEGKHLVMKRLHGRLHEEARKALDEARYDDAYARMEEAEDLYNRMAAEPPPPPAPPVKAEEEDDEEGEEEKAKMQAKMQAMEATLSATREQLTRLQKLEDERASAIKAERDREIEDLADLACSGPGNGQPGYPKEARTELVKFARHDLAGARKLVTPFLPKGGAPAQLFDRMSRGGAPLGRERDGRNDVGAAPMVKRVVSMGRTFIEYDHGAGMKIREIADSKDEVVRAKVDAHLTIEAQRPIKFFRLLAAEKVARADHPELFELGE